MHITCPHCQSPIEVVESPPPGEVVCPSCGSSFHLQGRSTTGGSLRPGQRDLGRFELLDIVGVGAFGTVYKARDPELDRIVATKVPRAGNLGSKEDADRFLREARSVAQLRHPSIVSVHEVGEVDRLPYLVSDFVQGVTLADLLSARRPGFRKAAELVAAVADALQYAHEQGVVHRDVKPSNILLDEKGDPHLMDFGLAKRAAGEITMTIDGQILGTPAYMSPEQARGEAHEVDGRSDVYSLGVILYQLLTGELPFHGTSRMLLHQVLHDEPRPPRAVNAQVPRDLETICLKAMAKDPQRRYASAGDFADDLRRFTNGEPIKARPITRVERLRRWAKRRKTMVSVIWGTLIGLAVSLLAAEAWFLTNPSKPEDSSTRAPTADSARSVGPYKFQIPLDFPALVSIRVAELWKTEATKGFRRQLRADFGPLLDRLEADVGLKPENIEEVVLFMRTLHLPSTFEINWYRKFPLVIVTTNADFHREAVRHWINPDLPEQKYQGKTYYGFGVFDSPFEALYFVDDRTFLFGSEPVVRTVLKQMALLGTSEPLGKATKESLQRHEILVGLNTEALFPLEVDASAQKDLRELFNGGLPQTSFKAESATLGLDLGVETKAELELIFATDADAARSASAVKPALGLLAHFAVRPFLHNFTGEPWGEQQVRLLDRFRSAMEHSSIERQNNFLRVNASVMSNQEELERTGAEAAGRILDVPALSESADNLHQLMLAMYNYHEQHKAFPPPAIYSKDAQPLLSWRVLLLPFLGEGDLFKQFRLDEPWDGPNNSKLIDRIPKVLAPVRGDMKVPHATFYQVFTGKSTVFEGIKGIRKDDISDGTSNTILVVEGADPVPWTKPQDLIYRTGQPLPKLGGLFNSGFNAALCDGTALFIRRSVQEKTMRAFITRNGDEQIDWKADPEIMPLGLH